MGFFPEKNTSVISYVSSKVLKEISTICQDAKSCNQKSKWHKDINMNSVQTAFIFVAQFNNCFICNCGIEPILHKAFMAHIWDNWANVEFGEVAGIYTTKK